MKRVICDSRKYPYHPHGGIANSIGLGVDFPCFKGGPIFHTNRSFGFGHGGQGGGGSCV